MLNNNFQERLKEKAHSKIRYWLLQFYHLITPNSLCDIKEHNRLRKDNGMIALTQGDYNAIQFKYRLITGISLVVIIISVLLLSIYFPAYYQKIFATATFTVDDLGDAGDISAGDGSCDTGEGVCTLRAAIEEANALAGDDTIQFSIIGTINIGGSLPYNTGNLTINGPGASDLIIDASGAGEQVAMGSSGSGVSFSVKDITIQNSTGGDCIYIQGALNGGEFSGLTLNNCKGNGINIQTALSGDVMIIDNTVSNITESGGNSFGINAKIASTTISNNIISNIVTHGIVLNATTGGTITNNTINSCGGSGIYSWIATGNLISGNTISNNGDASTDAGIYIGSDCNNNTIQNNTFSGNYYGVYQTMGTCSGLAVNNNSITNTINNALYIESDGTSITNNTITTTTGSQKDGIYIGAADDITISNNTISGATGSGIKTVEQGDAVDGASITNNTIYSNALHGLNLESYTNGTISNNTIYSNGSSPVSAFVIPGSVYSYGGTDYVEGLYLINDGEATAVTGDGFLASGNDAPDGVNDINLALCNFGANLTIFVSNDNYPDEASVEALAGGEDVCSAFVSSIFIAGDTATSDYTYDPTSLEGTGVTINEAGNTNPTMTYSMAYNSGVYLSASTDNTITSNTLYNNGNSLTLAGESTGNTATNNIFYSIDNGIDVGSSASLTNTYNLVWSDATANDLYQNSASYGTGEVNCNPSFTDTDTPTLTLKSISCAIESASDGSDLGANDFSGTKDTSLTVASSGADFISLQDAIDASWNGYSIAVAAGIYNEDIDFKSKYNITVTGASPATSILSGTTSGISFTGTSSANTLADMTLTGATTDLVSSASGTNNLENVIFISTSTNVTAGQVDVYYDTRGYVKDSGGNPISGASCSIAPEAGGSSISLGSYWRTGRGCFCQWRYYGNG